MPTDTAASFVAPDTDTEAATVRCTPLRARKEVTKDKTKSTNCKLSGRHGCALVYKSLALVCRKQEDVQGELDPCTARPAQRAASKKALRNCS